MKKLVSIALSVVMAAGVFSIVPASASAATAKVRLKKSSATLKITKKNGKTAYGKTTIKVKKAKGVTIKKITYKSADSSIAKVSKKGKVTAKKQGDVKITVNVKYYFNKKSYYKKLTFKVKVKDTRKKAKKTNKSAIIAAPATESQAATEAVTSTEATEPATVTEAEATTVPKTTVPETTAPLTEATEATVASTGYAEATEGSQPDVSEDVWGDTNHCVEFISQPESCSEEIQGNTNHCVKITVPTYNPNPYPAGVETDPYGNTFAPQETEPTTAAATAAATAAEAVTDAALPAPETFKERLSAFSNKLFAMTSAETDENYIFSPTSVYFALSLLHAIGDDAVKKDIEDFIGVDSGEIADTAELMEQLTKTYTNEYYSDNPTVVGEVSLSNSIWVDEDIKADVNEDTLKKLAEEYNC